MGDTDDAPADDTGDPVCWLHRLCAECGAAPDPDAPQVCWRCGASLAPDRRPPT